ncbi:MAG: TfoX/Sxy family DNA transformation protein [Planctomycetaceae bacterium]
MSGVADDTPVIELRNLGPACEAGLVAAGIKNAGDIRKLGVEETFVRLMVAFERDGRGKKCYNAAYLYALYGAIHDIDWRDLPDGKKDEFKAFAAEMRG